MIARNRVAFPLASAFALLATPLSAAPDRAPMSADDLVTMPRLGAPSVDRAGRMAVYTVTETDPESYQRKGVLHMRLLDAMDMAPVRLDLEGSDAQFGDDGWLYYLADDADAGDDSTSQVWRAQIAVDGSVSQAMQVTKLPRAVNGFAVSKDGKRLAVFVEIARDCASLDCDDSTKPYAPGPGTGRLYQGDGGFVRHWDHWETPGTYNRVFALELENGKASGAGVAVDGP